MRVALLPSGRRISRFAWIPRTVTPYVGAGGGAVNYDFQQHGSFASIDLAGFRLSGGVRVAF